MVPVDSLDWHSAIKGHIFMHLMEDSIRNEECLKSTDLEQISVNLT